LLGTLESLQGNDQAATAAFDSAIALAQGDGNVRHPQWWRVELAIAEHEERNKDQSKAREHYSSALDALLELGATADATTVVDLRQRLQAFNSPASR
jgi:hypothetical protein